MNAPNKWKYVCYKKVFPIEKELFTIYQYSQKYKNYVTFFKSKFGYDFETNADMIKLMEF